MPTSELRQSNDRIVRDTVQLVSSEISTLPDYLYIEGMREIVELLTDAVNVRMDEMDGEADA